ncbi:hypothetical protein K456DRAFT_1392951 [Colletotrichum gloeosporioides 23]|nr:hypothetical protein K456DRAFT_1392951 [Colletotrichum gloeosporioides 23]
MPADRHQPCFFLAYLPFLGAVFGVPRNKMLRGEVTTDRHLVAFCVFQDELSGTEDGPLFPVATIFFWFPRASTKNRTTISYKEALVVADSPACRCQDVLSQFRSSETTQMLSTPIPAANTIQFRGYFVPCKSMGRRRRLLC